MRELFVLRGEPESFPPQFIGGLGGSNLALLRTNCLKLTPMGNVVPLHQFCTNIYIVNPLINEAVALAPMFAGAGDGHIRYWNCGETASLITANVLGDSTTEYLGNTTTIKEIINRLNLVSSMTCPWTPSFRLNCRFN